jgi:HD-GYP domain-containing protein (c-di-GMP phosphodiesterase class II)
MGHARRVAYISLRIAKMLNLNEEDIKKYIILPFYMI